MEWFLNLFKRTSEIERLLKEHHRLLVKQEEIRARRQAINVRLDELAKSRP